MSSSIALPNDFAGRLKYLRLDAKLSQEELGARIEADGSTIAHFEAGRRKPNFHNIRKLAKALSVTTDFLMCRVGREGAVAFRNAEQLSGEDREFIQQIINAKTNGS